MVWRLLGFSRYDIFENMAIDEAIFDETLKKKKSPTLRFYQSDPPAISIGFFQDATKDLNLKKCQRERINLTRRITGGQAVWHWNEITYAVVASEQEKRFPADMLRTYKKINECIARGLSALGIHPVLAESAPLTTRQTRSASCFFSPVRYELLVNGRKICGSAQIRKRGGFLQHGLMFLSFRPDPTALFFSHPPAANPTETLEQSMTSLEKECNSIPDRKEMVGLLQQGFMEELDITLEEDSLTPSEEALKAQLMKKYKDPRWLMEGKKYFREI